MANRYEILEEDDEEPTSQYEVIEDTPATPPALTPTGLSSLVPTKEDVSRAYRPALEFGGASLAGIAALPTAPATAGVGPLLAAGGGYAAGSSLADTLDQLIGVVPRGKFFSLPTKEQVKSTIKDTAEDIKSGVTLEAGGQLIGIPIAYAGKALLTGVSKAVTRGPEYLQALREGASKIGINLTPAEIVGSKALSTLESILDNLPWTSGIIQRHRLGEMKKLNDLREELIKKEGSPERVEEIGLKIKNMIDSFMQKMGTVNKEAMNSMKTRLLQKMGSKFSYEDLDISAKEAVQRYQQQLNEQVHTAYEAVARQVPEIMAEPKNAMKIAERIVQEQTSGPASLSNQKLLGTAKYFLKTQKDVPADVIQLYQVSNPIVKKQLEEQFPELLNTGLEKSYPQLVRDIKKLNQEKFSRIDTSGGKYRIDPIGKDYDELVKALNDDLTDFAKQSGNEEILAAQEIANQLYKKKLALFEDKAFKLINNKYPGAVAKTVLQSGDTELIDRYRSLTGDALFNKAKQRLTNDILGLGPEQTVIGDDIRRRVVQLGESAKSIYSNDELNFFKKLSNAVDLREEFTSDIISNPILKNMVNKGETVPEGIAKSIIKPENTTTKRVVEKFIGKDGVKKVADAFLPELLATNQNTKDFMPQTFAKTFNEYGYDTIKAWYGDDFALRLKQLADVGERMGSAERLAGNPSGTGRFMITFNEGRRVGELAGKAITSAAGMGGAYGIGAGRYLLSLAGESSLILGSRQLAKLYTSPAGRKLFVDGLITPQTAKAAGDISGRILAILSGNILKAVENE